MKKTKNPLAGDGAITMADIARIAGVSKITVSRALGEVGVVNPETRARIRALADELGYQLNVSARNLRLRQSHTVAVIVEMHPSIERPMSDPYPLELLGGIVQELASTNYSILLTTRHGASAPAVQAADALVLLGQGPHEDAVRRFAKARRPMVVWGARRGKDEHVVVGSDNRQGGASVAERFIAIGRRRPVFFGDIDHPEIAERQAGFADVLRRHHIADTVVRLTEFTADAGFEAVRAMARKKAHFDAIFCCNDLLAMGAVRALIEMGLRMPEDVSVIGYDDTPIGAAFIPPLSSVHQSWRDGGAMLARKALALIGGQHAESETLPTRLVLRAT